MLILGITHPASAKLIPKRHQSSDRVADLFVYFWDEMSKNVYFSCLSHTVPEVNTCWTFSAIANTSQCCGTHVFVFGKKIDKKKERKKEQKSMVCIRVVVSDLGLLILRALAFLYWFFPLFYIGFIRTLVEFLALLFLTQSRSLHILLFLTCHRTVRNGSNGFVSIIFSSIHPKHHICCYWMLPRPCYRQQKMFTTSRTMFYGLCRYFFFPFRCLLTCYLLLSGIVVSLCPSFLPTSGL